MGWSRDDLILLPPEACATLDRAAIAAGTPGSVLMERAGAALAATITRRWTPRPVRVLCGPGNNGGDGYVVARLLAEAGWPVVVAALDGIPPASADAAAAAARWPGPVAPASAEVLAGGALVVDALFGAGLARPLEPSALALIGAARALAAPVVAVDVPSGVDGTTGAILGDALAAALTVSFVRAKPGHWLLPGRDRCGALVIADIGVDDRLVAAADHGWRRNAPGLWQATLPRRGAQSHKYRHGHAVVVGGGAWTTGAARLAAMAALRVGAGLVTVGCDPDSRPSFAAESAALMTRDLATPQALDAALGDPRLNAWAIGPGAGVGAATAGRVERILAERRPCVLDADALTSFADRADALAAILHDAVVLTPHEGELARLLPGDAPRIERARTAAARLGGVVVLKGSDTVIAAPDGRVAIQTDAPAALATAGSGDVLAGIVLGLLAQGMAAFPAAAAAVWLHAACARAIGHGLIATDLAPRLPEVLAAL